MHKLKKSEIKKILWGRNVKFILLAIFLIEILSFISFYSYNFRFFVFPLILLSFLVISFYKFELGVYIVLTELFIGSMGQIFYWNYFGINLSVRLLLWFILLIVWLINILKNNYKPKIIKSKYLIFFIPLFIFIIWGVLKGFINNNAVKNIFFDFNAWLYFALIFPFYDTILKRKNSFATFFQIIISSSIWLCLKTFVIFFIFSHNIQSLMSVTYSWVRDTRIGEITQNPDMFTRVFFQSHIFIVISLFILFIFLNKLEGQKNRKNYIMVILLMILMFLVVIISSSRSFWVGSLFGFMFFIFLTFRSYGYKKAFKNIIIMSGILILSLILISLTIKIPVGKSSQFSTTDSLKNRTKDISNEAAVSSRWNLLPKLWEAIAESPIMGEGFGTTITYQSNDPRVLQSSPDGQYTTYAFEWGWLDIWLKLGFLGLSFYLALFFKLTLNILPKKSIKERPLITALTLGLFIVAIINFFTPYLNHPLGIGYLIFSTALIDKLE